MMNDFAQPSESHIRRKIRRPDTTNRFQWQPATATINRLVNSSLTIIFCAFYPAFYLSPAVMGAAPSQLGIQVSDVSGGALLGNVFQHMPMPWSSQTWTSFPEGSSIWRVENLTQVMMLLFLWLSTRLLDPMTATYLWAFVGWTLSSFMVFRISRQLGLTKPFAYSGVLVFQALPMHRFLAETWVSYFWVCIPLLTLSGCMWFASNPSTHRFSVVLVGVGISIFFDLYWFYFSILIFVTCVSICHKAVIKLMRGQARYIWLLMVTGLLVSYSVANLVLSSLTHQVDLSRPLIAAPISLLTDFGAIPSDYVVPATPHFLIQALPRNVDWGWTNNPLLYGGVTVIALAFIAAGQSIRRHSSTQLRMLSICAVVLTVFSLSAIWNGIPLPAFFARNLFPGLQYFFRASYIVEPICCILAMYAVMLLYNRCRKPTNFICASVIVALCIMDLNPWQLPARLEYANQWAPISNVLREVPHAVVIASPSAPNLKRSWLDQYHWGKPVANGLYSRSKADQIIQDSSLSICHRIDLLMKMGITHLINIPSGEESLIGSPATSSLPCLKWLSQADVAIFGLNKTPVDLYRIIPTQPTVSGYM